MRQTLSRLLPTPPAGPPAPPTAEAMLEVGIDIRDQAVQASDALVTMGCGDACPISPGKRSEDRQLDDPAGRGIEAVRPLRDEIRRRMVTLLAELGVPAVA